MKRTKLPESVQRRLYAESMGKCMNPSCCTDLFTDKGDIIERAHLVPYCETSDNSFENIVLLCPNCHTNYDKNKAFDVEEVRRWKHLRRREIQKVFGKKYSTFGELQQAIKPLLEENKILYEQYYIGANKNRWDSVEPQILANNRAIKNLLQENRRLIQRNSEKEYSNLEIVNLYLAHIDEFETTRGTEEKNRKILFPAEINSIFGVSPVRDSLIPSTESLEALIYKLQMEGNRCEVILGVQDPRIIIDDGAAKDIVYLMDAPRLRQIYYSNRCFRGVGVRLIDLNNAIRFLRRRNITFEYYSLDNLREIKVKSNRLIFVYEYCFSKADLLELAPTEDSIVVNLHHWNGESCISQDAYDLARLLNVKLLTRDAFYEHFS